jgi:hypothetical protein
MPVWDGVAPTLVLGFGRATATPCFFLSVLFSHPVVFQTPSPKLGEQRVARFRHPPFRWGTIHLRCCQSVHCGLLRLESETGRDWGGWVCGRPRE